MKLIRIIKRAKKIEVTSFLKTLTGGQVFKINQYLEKHPEDYKKYWKI